MIVSNLKKSKKKVDYLVICSPNNLHFKHIKLGLKMNMNIICEKPIVINKYQFEQIRFLSKKYNKKINSILQLRFHPSILKLKKLADKTNKMNKINLKYHTERYPEYFKTWKGNDIKSGGIILNIGVHFFDLMLWIFGNLKNSLVIYNNKFNAKGILYLEKAKVTWDLSVKKIKRKETPKVDRVIKFNNKEIEFSNTFDDLHTLNYRKILKLKNSNLVDAFKSIQLVNNLKKNAI